MGEPEATWKSDAALWLGAPSVGDRPYASTLVLPFALLPSCDWRALRESPWLRRAELMGARLQTRPTSHAIISSLPPVIEEVIIRNRDHAISPLTTHL